MFFDIVMLLTIVVQGGYLLKREFQLATWAKKYADLQTQYRELSKEYEEFLNEDHDPCLNPFGD